MNGPLRWIALVAWLGLILWVIVVAFKFFDLLDKVKTDIGVASASGMACAALIAGYAVARAIGEIANLSVVASIQDKRHQTEETIRIQTNRNDLLIGAILFVVIGGILAIALIKA